MKFNIGDTICADMFGRCQQRRILGIRDDDNIKYYLVNCDSSFFDSKFLDVSYVDKKYMYLHEFKQKHPELLV